MPAKGLHHVDLAVSDVERSLAFYLELLGQLGWEVARRYPTYRGTEEVVYLGPPDDPRFGLRPADGGAHQYYGVGIDEVLRWWQGALGELHATVRAQDLATTGPSGGVFGAYVTTHELSVDGPLRETYLRGASDTPDDDDCETEIGWPIFRADAAA